MAKSVMMQVFTAIVIASVLLVTVMAGPYDYQPPPPPTATTQSTSSTEGPMCDGQADIVFVLDASTSIGTTNFYLQKQFLANVVAQFNVGPAAIRFSVVVFSTNASLQFNLKNYTINTDVRQAILNLTIGFGGSTYTGKALKLVREQAFSVLNGARPGVPKLAAVLTDGGSSEPNDTSSETALLKSSGVTVLVVGIGSGINYTELYTIASSPSLVFNVTDFNVLDTIKSRLVQSACQEKDNQEHKITCIVSDCTGKPSGNYPACDPECRQGYYYTCSNEYAYKMSCGLSWYVGPSGAPFTARMVFSPSTGNCVLHSESCPRDPYQYVVVPSQQTWTGQGRNRSCIGPNNTCRGQPDGNYPLCHPECQSGNYISCSNGEAIQMLCALGWYVDNKDVRFTARMVYNPSTDTCELTSSNCPRATPENTDGYGHGSDPEPEEQCDTQVDIMLCLDSSGSIGQVNYGIMANFAAALTTNFQVGPNTVRFAASVYSGSVVNRFTFSTYLTNAEVFQDLSQIPFLSDLTNTAAVLTYARTTVFPTARPNASRVAVVITDGFSDNPEATAVEADKLKQMGVTVLAVGVGLYVSQTELLAIASSPSLVFNVSSFTGLGAIKNQLTRDVCQAAVGCNGSKADCLFILDSSGSITLPNWELMLGFAANVTKQFTVGANDVLFSAISFSNTVERDFNFTTYLTKISLKQVLLNLTYIAGGTNTADALKEASTYSFTSANGARPNVPKVAILITDGYSNSALATAIEASNLKGTGATVIAVGVGISQSNELITIASSPKLVFQVTDFNVLAAIRDELVKSVCQSQ